MPTYYDGGFVVIDKNNKIYLKYGGDVVPVTSMCVTGGKLILGCGFTEVAIPNFPNLFVFDKSRYQEKGAIVAGTSSDETMSSMWVGKKWIAKNDRRLKLQRFVVAYNARATYQAGIFNVYYKVDAGDWTLLFTETLANDGSEHIIHRNKMPPLSAHLWQFKIESDDDFEVLWWYPYFSVEQVGTK